MAVVRIQNIKPLDGYRLRLTLTDGSVIERDVAALMDGPGFTPILIDPSLFNAVSVEGDTVVWPNGARLSHEELLGGGARPSV
ncbi:MAG: DUF2442 domain-containing protein [Nitrospirae bacterium]|nr:MAG: DUF2442 domain-containing protein [Nitrospirota bacterium]